MLTAAQSPTRPVTTSFTQHTASVSTRRVATTTGEEVSASASCNTIARTRQMRAKLTLSAWTSLAHCCPERTQTEIWKSCMP